MCIIITLTMPMNKENIVKIRNYLLVGAAAFAIEYGSFTLMEVYLDVSLVAMQSASFLAGLLISFLGSRYITFSAKTNERHTRSGRVQALSVLGLGLFNLFATNLIIYVLVQEMGITALLAKVIVMGLVVVWNFAIFNRIIFKTTRST